MSAQQRLDQLTVGSRMANRRVASHGLQSVDRPLAGTADQGALGAAMLVAKRNLQVKDVLAMTLKAEMPRLDDARMHRADRYLVNLLALDVVIVHDAGDGRFTGRPAPGVMAGTIRGMKAHRFEP